ncbi:hypothetical protein ACLI4Z_11265 [Natrialbaceae archaeon A-arb3/5]
MSVIATTHGSETDDYLNPPVHTRSLQSVPYVGFDRETEKDVRVDATAIPASPPLLEEAAAYGMT